jgi:hypothetical protein
MIVKRQTAVSRQFKTTTPTKKEQENSFKK